MDIYEQFFCLKNRVNRDDFSSLSCMKYKHEHDGTEKLGWKAKGHL